MLRRAHAFRALTTFTSVTMVAALAAAGWAPVAAEPEPPSLVPEEATPTEWVLVEDDFVVPASVAEQLGAATGFERQVANGPGFTVMDTVWESNRGGYVLRLETSPGVESLRPNLELAAARLSQITGGSFTVASGQREDTEPLQGEILVTVSATSPCGTGIAGCGGPRQLVQNPGTGGFVMVSGMVWIDPSVLGYPTGARQHVVEHELGHALGLSHHSATFEGRYQLMHPSRYDAPTFESGDINGLRALHPRPPANDAFAAATNIGAAGGVVSQVAFGATREAGEPAHGGFGAGGSVWYTWTAPSTGVVEINTAGSDGDTVVAVYTGGSVGSLTLVGANDDGDAVLGRFSRLLVPVTQGTTYRIAVDGAGGGSGILRTRVVPPSRSGFTPMRPTRLVDTRDGTGYSGGRIGGVAEVLQVQVAGNVGIPTTAQAAVMNVTVVAPDASGYLSVYPCDSPVLGSSSLNYGAGETIPNLVVTRTDGNGRVCVYSKAGAHVVVDIVGYGDDSSGSDYVPLQPARILDTRNGAGAGRSTPLRAGETWMLRVGGTGGVAQGAVAAVMNVTATRSQRAGYVTVWPCNHQRPTAASLNFAAGQTFPNLVVSGLDSAGMVCIYAHTDVHLIVDVNGYFATGGGRLTPLTPSRLLDTRDGTGASAVGALGAGGTLVVDVWGRSGVPSGADSAVLNLAVTQPAGSGFITMWPCDQPRPVAANLNFVGGETVANLVMSDLDAQGRVCVYSLTTTHVVVDVSGYTS